MKKNILTVGAYDRDNFGDILFYIITQKYLQKHNIIPGGITSEDMRTFMDEIVLPYPLLLEKAEWDIVWVVGGEVGGVTKTDAIRMVTSAEFDNVYLTAEKEIREKIDEFYSYKLGDKTTAYIPDRDEINRRNKNAKLILNSVGLASLVSVPKEVREHTNETLKTANYINVRDVASKEYCERYGIKANIAPDLVHTFKKHFGIPEKQQGTPDEYITVQFNELSRREESLSSIATSIDRLISSTGYEVLFFAAGIANHHDSFEYYQELQKYMRYSDKTHLYYERNPVALSACIANAKLWLGSSLHGRILAATYAVPRVSLRNEKVSTYAAYWDEDQPHDVTFKDVADAAQLALRATSSSLNKTASNLEALAEKETHKLIRELGI